MIYLAVMTLVHSRELIKVIGNIDDSSSSRSNLSASRSDL